jgi:hypothetical protein
MAIDEHEPQTAVPRMTLLPAEAGVTPELRGCWTNRTRTGAPPVKAPTQRDQFNHRLSMTTLPETATAIASAVLATNGIVEIIFSL